MIYVTDTRPLILAATNRHERLGQKARKIFASVDEGKNRIVVPVTVLQEVMLLAEKKTLRLKIPFHRWAEEIDKGTNFMIHPFTLEILLEAQGLPSIPDPADKMIVATARCLGCPLITAKKALREGEWVETIWD